jgi:sulfur-oxidizing protein SoxY
MLGAVGNAQPSRRTRHRFWVYVAEALGTKDGSSYIRTNGGHPVRWPVKSSKLNRREFALGGAAAVVAIAGLPLAVVGQDSAQAWEQAVKKVLGDAKPIEGKVLIDMPEIAENGNTVPFTISVDSPMSETDRVKAIHVIATANPQPGVAVFRFSPLSGKAAVASRMRLARTQDVIGIAELSDGRFLMSKRNVKVTIGGCGG